MKIQQYYRLQDFRGENNRESVTHQGVFGERGRRQMRALRGYHLIGYGRALSRRGYKPYIAAALNGAAAVQGLAQYQFQSSQALVGVSNTKIRSTTGASWADITGSVVQTAGQDVLLRFGTFLEGATGYLIGTDGVNPPWKWAGTGNAEAITGPGVPTACKDVKEFHGYLMLLGCPEDPSRLHYSTYGVVDFSQNGLIDCTRDSAGVALAQHSRDVLLVFFERQIYRVYLNTNVGSTFITAPIQCEPAEACISRTSVVTAGGYTYWMAAKGPMRWAQGRPEYIGGDIEEVWAALNHARDCYIQGWVRGAPWTEVAWLVSYGDSSKHNLVMLWNTRLEGWTFFPVSPFAGVQEFNCACNWRDALGVERTIVGDYVGVAHEAWGHTGAESGFTDNGSQVETELTTGMLNFDYPGISKTRNLIVDIELTQSMDFDVVIEAGGAKPVRTKPMHVGVAGAELDVDFMLDESYLQQALVSWGRVKVDLSARYTQASLHRLAGDGVHIINALTFTHLPGGMRES